MHKLFIVLFLLPWIVKSQSISPWQEGYLDIHHINTGSGNSTFFVFPDGTTMLLDAGDVDRSPKTRMNNPLKIAPRLPDSTFTAAQSIHEYLVHSSPTNQIDYAVITHFHPDHYGAIGPSSKTSRYGSYQLSGITEVHEYNPIKKLLDRDYPDYQYPVSIVKNNFDSTTFLNYLKFIQYHHSVKTLSVEALKAGSKTQITLLHKPARYPSFQVRNIKSNGDIWTGESDGSTNALPASISRNLYNENPLSIAFKISYGAFDYFTGGDMTGITGFGFPAWFDVETRVANVVGEVEAMTLNHHGMRDASNEFFLKTLAPRVIVQQSWSSNHPGEEVLHRIISPATYEGQRDIFATYVHSETITTYGRWLTDNYKSTRGHIVIRVLSGGSEFMVYILDDTKRDLPIVKTFGPYTSK
jgi:glyoxylase-like metal-dependent hydrolase (beta-lactamase superfamily II)